MTLPPHPTPGQRVSRISLPVEYALPEQPGDAAGPVAQDAYRQTQFVLGGDLRLFADGMRLQLALLHDSSHSRYRTHAYAAVVSNWSRAYASMADACLLVSRGAYASAPSLIRAACELIAAGHQVAREEFGAYAGWLLGHLKPDEQHKAFEAGLGHFFAGSAIAEDPTLRLIYRAASDLGRPNFGATLMLTGSESNNQRLAYAFADPSFHVGLAEMQLGWLLSLCERQLAVAVHLPDVFNVSEQTHSGVAAYARRVQETLANPNRARIEEIEVLADAGSKHADEEPASGEAGTKLHVRPTATSADVVAIPPMKRWLVHNFRRQPSGAPKKWLM